jgi:hypothetical protein
MTLRFRSLRAQEGRLVFEEEVVRIGDRSAPSPAAPGERAERAGAEPHRKLSDEMRDMHARHDAARLAERIEAIAAGPDVERWDCDCCFKNLALLECQKVPRA